MLQSLENRPLFVREDENLDSFNPKFTEQEVNDFLTVHTEDYYILLGPGGGGTKYWVTTPAGDMTIYRAGEDKFFGDAVRLVEEFRKKEPQHPATLWINANARELNAAKHYWVAVNARKKAELNRLRANLAAAEAKAFAEGKWGLTDEERKALVLEYGYDPEQSYDY